MMEIKKIVAQNLLELRKANNLTQAELAGKLNYSDKSVSKWENGESLPDIDTLCALADMYGVTLDFLTHEGTADHKAKFIKKDEDTSNKIIITSLMVTVVWIIAAAIFVYIMLNSHIMAWMAFVWAVPASMLLVTALVRKWFDPKAKYWTLSVFLWTALLAVCLQLIKFNVWPILIVGIPIQVSIVLSPR